MGCSWTKWRNKKVGSKFTSEKTLFSTKQNKRIVITKKEDKELGQRED